MARFDRYMLSQLMLLFGFFSLVLVAIYWINRAVSLFDRLIGDGQTALVFVEFTALTLPAVIRMVLPISAFAATLYVTNRLSSESELVVMQATGFSPWRLARPVLYFGVIVALMMAILMNVLEPAASKQLKLRESEISRNITARLLTEGTFLHPSEGMTFYIREITPEGRMNDVFLSDRTSGSEYVTHTASSAYLVRTESGPALVMIDGLTQRLQLKSNQLIATRFSDLSYDISGFVKEEGPLKKSLKQTGTRELLRAPDKVRAETGVSAGQFAEELNNRITQPLFALVSALLGFATLLFGGFSRFGIWRHVLVALALLIALKVLESTVAEPVLADAGNWPLLYLPSLLGLALTFGLLASSAGWIRRRFRARGSA